MADSASPVASKVRWTVVALLFAATSVNYIDRQVLGILAPTLTRELGWRETDYAAIVSWFSVAYGVGLLGMGRFLDRIGVRRGLACAVGLWSLAAMGHALVRTVTGFSVARALLGIGESGNFPAGVKAVAEWFPKRERALATGIFNAGSNVGVVLAALLVPWIALALGWRWAFVATGALDLAWLGVWLTIYRQPSEHPRLSDAELAWIRSDPVEPAGPVPWRSLLARRQTWAFIVGKAMTDPVWLFYLFWLPKFLDTTFGVRLGGLAAPLVVIYVAADIGSVTGGWQLLGRLCGARGRVCGGVRVAASARPAARAHLGARCVACRPSVIKSVYHYEDCRHSRDPRLSTARGAAAPRQRLPLGPLRADDRRGRDRHRPAGPGRAGGRWRKRHRRGPSPEIVPRRARPAADRSAP